MCRVETPFRTSFYSMPSYFLTGLLAKNLQQNVSFHTLPQYYRPSLVRVHDQFR